MFESDDDDFCLEFSDPKGQSQPETTGAQTKKATESQKSIFDIDIEQKKLNEVIGSSNEKVGFNAKFKFIRG